MLKNTSSQNIKKSTHKGDFIVAEPSNAELLSFLNKNGLSDLAKALKQANSRILNH